jgi:PKD repeat protein
VAAFAAVRSADKALTVMVLNKYLTGSTLATINLANFSHAGLAQVWQLTSGNSITRLVDVSVTGTSFGVSLPQQSITLFVLPASTGGNLPPMAQISASPLSGIVPLTVGFDGSASSDSDGSIASFAWNFGDGGTASGGKTSHTYTTVGAFTVTLIVTDNLGSSASANLTIQVNPDPNLIKAPSNLSAIVSKRTVNLRWTDNSTNEQGFYVERAVSTSTPTFTRVATLSANTTKYSEQAPIGTYLYRVQAFNLTTGRVSLYSNQSQARVK